MNHLNQIKRALDYIESNLAADNKTLSVEAVAREAGMSLWHFQRMFRALTGETVAAYIRKRRLTEASFQLRGTTARILDIALSCGFESQESFTRAFKNQFSYSPAAFRKEKDPPHPLMTRLRLNEEYIDHLYRGMIIHPDMMTIKPMSLIGMETPFHSVLSEKADNILLIPRLWDAFYARIDALLPLTDSPETTYGIVDATHVKSVDAPIRYFAGIAVVDDTPAPQGFLKKTMNGGLYAAFRHTGSFANIAHTINYVHGSWLPKQAGLDLRSDVEIEIFESRERSPLTYCLPISRLE